MKKLILCLLCIFAAFSTNVLAATLECDYNKDNYKLTVSGDAGVTSAHLRVSAVIMKGNEALPQSGTGESDKVIATMTCTADHNGKYIFTPVTVSSGECTVYVSVYGGDRVESKYLSMPTTENITSFVDRINGQTTASGINGLLRSEAMAPTYYADLSYYTPLSDSAKLKVAEFVLERKNEGRYEADNPERASNLDEDIILASFLVYTSENKDAELVGKILNVEESDLEARYKNVIQENFDLAAFRTTPAGEYSKAPTAQALLRMIADVSFANIEQFKDAVITGVINYKLANGTPWADVDEILYAHQSELEVRGLNYQKLNEKRSSQQAMNAILANKPYSSIENLISKVNTILLTNYTTQNGGSSDGDSYSGSVGVAQPGQETGAVVGNGIFADISKNHWAYQSVEYLAFQGIVSGTGSNRFEPDRSVKREEFVQMIAKAFNLINAGDECTFDDVAENAWYKPAIASATQKGIISGFSSECFGVGYDISRQDMAVIAYNTLKQLKPDIQEVQLSADSFTDCDSISSYAKNAVGYMYENKIISGMGDGRFAGKETATRAQAAVIIFGLINFLR